MDMKIDGSTTLVEVVNDVADKLGDATVSYAEKDAEGDEGANIVDGLFAIARSIESLAKAVHKLGNADASTPMGALESHGLVVKEAAELLASAISNRST